MLMMIQSSPASGYIFCILKCNEDVQLTFRLTQYSVKIRSKNLLLLVQKVRKASNAEELRPGDPSTVLKVIVIATIVLQLVLSYGHSVVVKACDAVRILQRHVVPATIQRYTRFAQNILKNVSSN